MACHHELLLLCIFLMLCATTSSQQLQYSQTQALRQIQKHLEYPNHLGAWSNTKDLCIIPPSISLSLTCDGSSVTGLKIIGDRTQKRDEFDGYPLHNSTLSQDFSMDSFVTTLARLSSLKVVILVSLGIWGSLPDKIHRLYALEVLDLSSNYIYGSVPPDIARMGMLQTLVLDGNFINATVPEWLTSLSNLTVLSLKRNKLQGPLPKTVGAIITLDTLALSGNKISGELPELSGLSSLQLLDLRDNSFDSNLPMLPDGLVTVLLSRNSFRGEIPHEFAKLTRLHHLDLSYNLLEGPLPEDILSLPNISYLNLASNMLSGSLPKGLTCSSQLGFVDISINRFTGTLPSCLDPSSNKIIVKFQENCLAIDSIHQHNAAYCSKAEQKHNGSRQKHVWLLIGVIGGAFIFVLLVSILIYFSARKSFREDEQALSHKYELENSSAGFSRELLANARFMSQKQKLGMQLLPLHRQFSLEELQEATKNFSPSACIGEGSIGKVYRGRLENGIHIAVKCLSLSKRDLVRNLKLRLDLLSKLRHPHLVCLLGHCIDIPINNYDINRIFLVYEYMPNGTLRDLISEKGIERALRWSDRLAISISIAKAVHFLRTGVIPGFFNNRLKTSNILMDDHYMAKVSDYGLSIITEEIDKHEVKIEGQKSSHAVNLRKSAYFEDDIYTFGHILLEMLFGPSILEKGEAFFLDSMAEASSNPNELNNILDPIVLSTSTQSSLSTVLSIAKKCICPDPSSRPSIEDVLWNLQYAEQAHTASQGDQRSDATSQA